MTEPDTGWRLPDAALVEAADEFVRNAFASAPPPVPTVCLQDIADELARIEASRTRLLVQPGDADRVRAAVDTVSPWVKVETSDLVPDGEAYLINPQAINEAIERREPWPPNAAVRWSE